MRPMRPKLSSSISCASAGGFEVSESIGFEPISQFGKYALYSLPDAVVGVSGIAQACGANPNRLALIIDVRTSGVLYRVSPSSNISTGLVGVTLGSLPTTIHAAVYPVMCQGIWYIIAPAISTYAVYEVVEQF